MSGPALAMKPRSKFLAAAGTLLLGFAGMLPAGDARAASACGLSNCVVMWNETLVSIIRQTSALLIDGPPEVANQIAVVDTAMFNAVNAATGMQYNGYRFTGGAVAGADAEAAALAAGYGALMGLFAAPGAPGNPSTSSATFGALLAAPSPTGKPALSTAITNQINAAYDTAKASLSAPANAVAAGLALGTAQAADMVNRRNLDGAYSAITSGLNTFMPPGAGITPGVYIPPGGRPAMYPAWGSVTPWTMTSSTQFDPGAPPALTSATYAAAILKTECLGGAAGLGALSATTQAACAAASGSFKLPATAGKLDSLAGAPPTNSELALFWNDPGTTLQPPGHWLQITDTAAGSTGLDLLGSARISAMVGVGLADAGIAAWQAKYDYLLWRPQDAIRDCAAWSTDFATCEGGWSSLIATPPHPDYVAGHPTFSYAAATVLEDFFGTAHDDFCTSSDAYNNGPGNPVAAMTLCYDSFLSAASDATTSRIYGGIHTDFASNAGAAIGLAIGTQILANDFLVPEPASLLAFMTGLAMLAGLRSRTNKRTLNG